jgi:hypothetical protein
LTGRLTLSLNGVVSEPVGEFERIGLGVDNLWISCA